MRRRTFIRELVAADRYLKRHGSRHDIYANPHHGKQAPVPRHPEIKESLCRLIRNELGIEKTASHLKPASRDLQRPLPPTLAQLVSPRLQGISR